MCNYSLLIFKQNVRNKYKSFELQYDRYRETFCASCCAYTLTIYEKKYL